LPRELRRAELVIAADKSPSLNRLDDIANTLPPPAEQV
jgi:hypothetical protein